MRLPIATPLLLLLIAGCGLFDPRDPEPPSVVKGTYTQPDQPEDVIANLEAAVEEMNTGNYRRLFAEEYAFHPTPEALVRSAVWSSWGAEDENSYFTALAAAAAVGTGHSLVLYEAQMTNLTDDSYLYEATYVLSVNHKRPEAPKSVQGRITLTLRKGTDGLYRITEWRDDTFETAQSWSDLKVAFTL